MAKKSKINRGMSKIPRLIDFQNSKVHSADLLSAHYKFLSLKDAYHGDVVFEFAHNPYNPKIWIRKDYKAFTVGQLIREIKKYCGYHGIVLEFFVDDPHPSNPRTAILKRLLSYHLTKSRNEWGEIIENRYDLECLDDVKCFYNLEQFTEICKALGW